jgi:hypothetical protein
MRWIDRLPAPYPIGYPMAYPYDDFDPEEPEPEPAMRCSRCGAFISPKNPKVEKYAEEPGEECEDFGWIPGRPAAEVITWPCAREGCGGGQSETYYL